MADPVEMQLFQYLQSLPEASRLPMQMAYTSQRKDRNTALILSLFLGGWGVDRFYLGQAALGVLKLLTCGGLFVWTFIDWFMIMGATDSVNQSVLYQLRMMYRPSQPQLGQGYPQQQQGYPPQSGPQGWT